jgi:hypothetical protein
MNILPDRGSMLAVIRDPGADLGLRALLARRFEQIGGTGAIFYVAEPCDGAEDVETAIGWPLTQEGEPCYEWSELWPGGWLEIAFFLADDGPAHILLAHDGSALGALVRAAEGM